MASRTLPILQQSLSTPAHFLAYCWKLTRSDGAYFTFTDHDHNLTLADGLSYQPAGGFSSSAKQRQAGMKANNFEVVGIFDNAALTYDDLRAGRYRDARVDEYLVDWRFPWLGAVFSNTYWIASITLEDDIWTAQIQGVSLWLNRPVGKTLDRNCQYDLGDADCKKVISATAGVVASIVSPLVKVTATGLGAFADGYFDYGKFLWVTGPNVGFPTEVRSYLNSGGTITLQLRTPFAIAVGDQFNVYPGCNKNLTTCNSKFSNVANFGGFPDIPGNDSMMASPSISSVEV